MTRRFFPAVALGLVFGAVSGCATVPKSAGFQEVRQVTEQRIGLKVHWSQGMPEDTMVAETLQAMLKKELTVDEAVQIALLNNPSLQASFEELGIAQADLVQAGLLQNPVFSGAVRFPDKSEVPTNTEFSVSQDLMDILLRPLRKRLAAAQFEQARFRVSDAVLSLSAEVRSAYFTLQGAEHTWRMLQTIFQAAQAAAELAERQHAAGNINDLDHASEQAAFQQAKLDLERAEAEVLAQRERLNRLMGLGGSPSWRISDRLPSLPLNEPDSEDLEARALSQRLDLAAARQEVKVFEQALVLARKGIIPTAVVGAGTEREPEEEGATSTGPSFELPIPLFDQRQATIARAEAQLRQSQSRLSALETQIRSEVRATRDRLMVNRRLVERYRDVLIPLRERIVAESQKHYNFMLIGAFQLLQAKREEVSAYREYIETFRDYWNARAELERAVGGRLPGSEAGVSPSFPPAQHEQEPLHEHHH